MTVGLLLAFSYAVVMLKMPKEANQEENFVIQIIRYFKYMDRFCYFEVAYLLRVVIYPSLFNMTLNLSRVVDIEPLIEFKKRMLIAQKSLTRTFMPLEMITHRRETDESFKEFLEKEAKEKEEAEKEWKELEEKKKAEEFKKQEENLPIEQASGG